MDIPPFMKIRALASRVVSFVKRFRVDLVLILFVFLSTLVSVFPEGVDSVHLGARLSNSPNEIVEIFGLSDGGSYLKAAIELSTLGGLTTDKFWVINLWPPGMVIVNAALIEVFGNGYGVAYGLLIVIVWTTLLSAFAVKVLRRFGSLAAFTSSALVLVSGPMQSWIFGSGLFYAEGFSTAAYLSGLILLIKSSQSIVKSRMISLGFLAGTSFAAAAYFRSSFSLIEPALLLMTLVFSILYFAGRYSLSNRRVRSKLTATALPLGSAWIAMTLLMEPWLRFTEMAIRPGLRTWSVVSGGFFRGAWVERNEMAGFLANGGVGWACELDPDTCQEIAASEAATGQLFPISEIVLLTVKTALLNLDQYLLDRFEFISTGWFSNEASGMGTPAVLWGFILLVGFVLVVSLIVRKISSNNYILASILILAVILTLPLFIGHIEPRYFIPLKMLILLIPWIMSPNDAIDHKNSSRW